MLKLTDTEIVHATLDKSNVWNKARQAFRFRSAALDRCKSPIDERRKEFEAVIEIVQVVLSAELENVPGGKEFLHTLLASAETSLRESAAAAKPIPADAIAAASQPIPGSRG